MANELPTKHNDFENIGLAPEVKALPSIELKAEEATVLDPKLLPTQLIDLFSVNSEVLNTLCKEIGVRSLKIIANDPEFHNQFEVKDGDIVISLNKDEILSELSDAPEDNLQIEDWIDYLNESIKETLGEVATENLLQLRQDLLAIQYLCFLYFVIFNKTPQTSTLAEMFALTGALYTCLCNDTKRLCETFSACNIFGFKLDRYIRFKIKSQVFNPISQKVQETA